MQSNWAAPSPHPTPTSSPYNRPPDEEPHPPTHPPTAANQVRRLDPAALTMPRLRGFDTDRLAHHSTVRIPRAPNRTRISTMSHSISISLTSHYVCVRILGVRPGAHGIRIP
jgi:hypothetical protein